MIDVCLIGTGAMMPLPNRPLAAALIRIGGEVILFDCGENTQVNWRVSNFSFRACGTILLSHLHADHVAGIPGILYQIMFSNRTEPLTIVGPPGTHDVVSALAVIVGRPAFEVRIIEIDGATEMSLLDNLTLRTLELDHRIPCLGYRLDLARQPRFDPQKARALGVPVEHWSVLQRGEAVDGFSPDDVLGEPRRGLSVSLIGDTRLVDGMEHFVRESDLLISEATYLDESLVDEALKRGHMTLKQAADVARAANVGVAWFTHFSPRTECPSRYQPVAESYFAHAKIGFPGLKTTLSFDDKK